jgi:hypothetical protein
MRSCRTTAWLCYRLREDAPDYRRGKDWRLKQPLSGKVIRRVRDG